jgi:hypothetical protein
MQEHIPEDHEVFLIHMSSPTLEKIWKALYIDRTQVRGWKKALIQKYLYWIARRLRDRGYW